MFQIYNLFTAYIINATATWPVGTVLLTEFDFGIHRLYAKHWHCCQKYTNHYMDAEQTTDAHVSHPTQSDGLTDISLQLSHCHNKR